MDDLIGHTLSVFLGFFAIMNPIANTPVFLGLTAGDDRAVTRRVARNAMLITFVLIVIFCVLGKLIFELFGITLPAFRITGGVLVALIGYHMLQGEQSSVQNPSSADTAKSLETQLSVAVSPLAVPILAGPGTIATAMNFAAAAGSHEHGDRLCHFVCNYLFLFRFWPGNGSFPGAERAQRGDTHDGTDSGGDWRADVDRRGKRRVFVG